MLNHENPLIPIRGTLNPNVAKAGGLQSLPQKTAGFSKRAKGVAVVGRGLQNQLGL
jgi:hypothetical protein